MRWIINKSAQGNLTELLTEQGLTILNSGGVWAVEAERGREVEGVRVFFTYMTRVFFYRALRCEPSDQGLFIYLFIFQYSRLMSWAGPRFVTFGGNLLGPTFCSSIRLSNKTKNSTQGRKWKMVVSIPILILYVFVKSFF